MKLFIVDLSLATVRDVLPLAKVVTSPSPMSQRSASGWEHFSHGADIGVRGFGPTREAAFQEVARALTAVVTDPDLVQPSQPVQIACDASTDDVLLFDWLNALIYEMATRRMLFNAFDVAIQNGRLTATAWGEPVDRVRHEPAVEIKGATYTSLLVERQSDGTWRAGCVVDV